METRQIINLALACAADAERQGHHGLAAALRELAEDCQFEQRVACSSTRVPRAVDSMDREPQVFPGLAIVSRSTRELGVDAYPMHGQSDCRYLVRA